MLVVLEKCVFTCFHPPCAKAAFCLSMQWDLLGAGAVLVSEMVYFRTVPKTPVTTRDLSSERRCGAEDTYKWDPIGLIH